MENKKDTLSYNDIIVNKNKFYVYVYLDPRYESEYIYESLSLKFNYKPIYIGKGKNERIFDHFIYVKEKEKYSNNVFYNTLNKIKSFGPNKIIQLIKYFEDEKEAFDYEKKLIDEIGRKIINKNFSLLNITVGGRGVLSSSIPKELRKKLYGSPGEKNPAYRKDLDENIHLIIEDYIKNNFTLRDLSQKYKTDFRSIKKRFLKHNVEISTKNQYLKVSKCMKKNNPMKKKIKSN